MDVLRYLVCLENNLFVLKMLFETFKKIKKQEYLD